MKTIIRSLILILLFPLPEIIFSQGFYQEADMVYGLDPVLYNGRKYSYFLPPGTGGTQYIYSGEYTDGEIIIESHGESVTFGGVDAASKNSSNFLLNYDVYNQKLLLKYPDETGAEQIIEVSEAWLKGFSLGSSKFIYLQLNNESRFFQALGDGKYLILYHWRKNLKLENSGGRAVYSFTNPMRTRYVLIDGKPVSYGSKNSFVRLFDPAGSERIKEYMKVNRINLKKSPDSEIAALINFISNLD